MSPLRSWLHRAADQAKAVTPQRLRRRVVQSRLAARQATSGLRGLPDLLIVGAQRCGTSSLYKYLGRHPDITPSLRKEVQYFSTEYDRGLPWYRAHFPIDARRRLSFEATPDYLFHPRAAERSATVVPGAKVLVILRDPVDRAYSHYHHMRRLGFETLDFPSALDAEETRIGGDLERSLEDPTHRPKQWMRYSYVARGRYARQLHPWLRFYDRDQVRVIGTTELYTDPAAVLADLQQWLGLDLWLPDEFRNYSYVSGRPDGYAELDPSLRKRLARTFADDNAELEQMGYRLDWASA